MLKPLVAQYDATIPVQAWDELVVCVDSEHQIGQEGIVDQLGLVAVINGILSSLGIVVAFITIIIWDVCFSV